MRIACICANCSKEFIARKADVNRGWANCCDKSCAAVYRERLFNHLNKLTGIKQNKSRRRKRQR